MLKITYLSLNLTDTYTALAVDKRDADKRIAGIREVFAKRGIEIDPIISVETV